MNTIKPFTVTEDLDFGHDGRLELEEKDIGDMKTENTCMHCTALECYVRLNCEDNELATETQEPENQAVTVQVMESKLIAKTVIKK